MADNETLNMDQPENNLGPEHNLIELIPTIDEQHALAKEYKNALIKTNEGLMFSSIGAQVAGATYALGRFFDSFLIEKAMPYTSYAVSLGAALVAIIGLRATSNVIDDFQMRVIFNRASHKPRISKTSLFDYEKLVAYQWRAGKISLGSILTNVAGVELLLMNQGPYTNTLAFAFLSAGIVSSIEGLRRTYVNASSKGDQGIPEVSEKDTQEVREYFFENAVPTKVD